MLYNKHHFLYMNKRHGVTSIEKKPLMISCVAHCWLSWVSTQVTHMHKMDDKK